MEEPLSFKGYGQDLAAEGEEMGMGGDPMDALQLGNLTVEELIQSGFLTDTPGADSREEGDPGMGLGGPQMPGEAPGMEAEGQVPGMGENPAEPAPEMFESGAAGDQMKDLHKHMIKQRQMAREEASMGYQNQARGLADQLHGATPAEPGSNGGFGS
jgi:hypothetical protein